MEAGKRTAAEADCTDGTGGVVVCDTNVGTGGFVVDGHFGHDGHAHSSGNHAEQAAELATFENNLWMETCAVASSERVFAEAMAVPKKQERFVAKVLQRKSAEARKAVSLGNRGEERFGQDGKGFKFVATNG